MKNRSIQQSLLNRIGLCMGLLLCILSTWIYLTVRHGLYKELDKAISQTAALLSNQLELEDGKIIFEWQEGQGTNSALIDAGLFQFWDETTGVTTRSLNLHDLSLPKFSGEGNSPVLQNIRLPKNHHHARAIGLRIHPYNSPENVVYGVTKPQIDPKTRPFILVVARDANSIHNVLNRVGWILCVGSCISLAGLYLLISRVIHVSLRPIDSLNEQMKNRTAGELDSALEMPSSFPAELVGLAENFDSLLSRVALARIRERDFIRHAAHELRTPVAGLRAIADLALSQPRSATEYADQMTNCQKTIIELSELVTRLTALSRVGGEKPAIRLVQTNLAAVLDECLKPFLSAFSTNDITLHVELESDSLWALADTSLAKIIFTNLFDNVTSYANQGGEVDIRAFMIESKVIITVANTISTSIDDIDRLFEPLFRSDTSRHDSTSHLGIGLTLSRDAANAMNASLVARKISEGWIEFKFSI